ncbi:hypothetical protein [Pilimelia columellifera]|uniref:Uncharacterized protein n=1 Tax=Pilimelia columellifera subsp. columellifera TaxID=706583 RepID=A0ABP6ABI6_9ACTN
MTEPTTARFPRRDEHRRIVALTDLTALLLAAVVAGAAVLIVLDLAFQALGGARFGQESGWLAVVAPLMIIVEEFRTWSGWARVPVALLAATVAFLASLVVVALADGLPPLASGALGAAAFALVYAPLWFHGVRLAAGPVAEVKE